MKVSVIIIHWNTPNHLTKLLDSLAKEKSLQIIVIDNASDKTSSKVLKNRESKIENLKVVFNKKNLGYAAACNQGSKIAKGEWLLFLNPDVTVTLDLIKHLIKSAEKKGYDATSPLVGENYRKPIPTPLTLLAEFTPLKYIIPLAIFRKHTLFGGCLLIRKTTLDMVGGWDERFFLWFEDSDLTRRLVDAGLRIGWIKSDIAHLGGASFTKIPGSKRRRIFFESMQKYADKHFSATGKLIARVLHWKYTKNL